jgi:hypothetical protein
MLTRISLPTEITRNSRKDKRLWHNECLRTPSLGCDKCPEHAICGGLRVEQSLYDCLGLCCGKPDDCDSVCRLKPVQFADRVREIQGFSFDNIPSSTPLQAPSLPRLVPVIYHRASRVGTFDGASVVALPLYKVIGKHSGEARYKDRADLARGFGVSENTTILLTGTDRDRALERWWSLGDRRRDAIKALRLLGIKFVTTPNYSLFTDQPRWDDLHSMKRIAITHEEFLSEGLPAALHLNARTDKDWQRWKQYLTARPEITHIAFEFGTGAGYPARMPWYATHLSNLALAVDRPLHLIVRGGNGLLPPLRGAFAQVTVLETTAFMKTMHRKRLEASPSGKYVWSGTQMGRSETLDSLLLLNWRGTLLADGDAYRPPPPQVRPNA